MQVRKKPFNKKELAKNEEDIIVFIEMVSNSLIVYETKLKVSHYLSNVTQAFVPI
jgi:kinesin family protein 2/24